VIRTETGMEWRRGWGRDTKSADQKDGQTQANGRESERVPDAVSVGEQEATAGTVPSLRSYHSLTSAGGRLFAFGGWPGFTGAGEERVGGGGG
jgi:hypothetical protein